MSPYASMNRSTFQVTISAYRRTSLFTMDGPHGIYHSPIIDIYSVTEIVLLQPTLHQTFPYVSLSSHVPVHLEDKFSKKNYWVRCPPLRSTSNGVPTRR